MLMLSIQIVPILSGQYFGVKLFIIYNYLTSSVPPPHSNVEQNASLVDYHFVWTLSPSLKCYVCKQSIRYPFTCLAVCRLH